MLLALAACCSLEDAAWAVHLLRCLLPFWWRQHAVGLLRTCSCRMRSAPDLPYCMPAAHLLRLPHYVPAAGACCAQVLLACCGHLLSSHTCVPAVIPASECHERGRHHHLWWHQGQQGAWPPPRAFRAAHLAVCCWSISGAPQCVLSMQECAKAASPLALMMNRLPRQAQAPMCCAAQA